MGNDKNSTGTYRSQVLCLSIYTGVVLLF